MPTESPASWHGWVLDAARKCLVLRLRDIPLVEVTLWLEDLARPADRIAAFGGMAKESWFTPECQTGLQAALAALLAGRWLQVG